MSEGLRIQGYSLGYRTRAGEREALSGIDLAIAPGETDVAPFRLFAPGAGT